ncbi:ABC transporter ATP-binding protein [Phytoactinopolyspora alkaliphila]|uniref:ABC transporter ATP-binding protein n=1 Tax=Phytoactinopolyspora alkaliphila TaxID=1783498 RepID=A0A6N9YUK3_9ACTN|nr:ABC transporter ATP-binding protein [Phytoactinopolyspora alkaliphila]NED98488.1 ABC transporter ATP-binding protein [Phytoactinopolyspora alkaliphila]
MPALEIDDLRITYRGSRGVIPAVRGISLSLEPGDTLGLAGESGCGKSTVAAAALRLLPPGTEVSGRIMLGGEDILTMSFGRLRAVRWAGASIVFQGAMHSLNPVHRIARQVAEPIVLHEGVSTDAAEKRAIELMAQVGLPAWRARSYPHELSGGQRQRVMIAMALACSPQLIIADEATTALDVMIQAQVLALLEGLVADRNIALIMISHDLSVLAETCARLAVMYAGKLVEEGPSHEVFGHARHPYAQALSAAFPTVGDPAERRNPHGLAGDPPDPAALPTGCSFHPRCPVVMDTCASTQVELRHARSDWQAACLRVEPMAPAQPAMLAEEKHD